MKRLTCLITLMFIGPSLQATMIMDKGTWTDLSHSAQMGYVIAYIDSSYYVVEEEHALNVKKQKIRDCIQGMDTDDFIEIIDMRYNDLENYRRPPWSQLNRGILEICGVAD